MPHHSEVIVLATLMTKHAFSRYIDKSVIIAESRTKGKEYYSIWKHDANSCI